MTPCNDAPRAPPEMHRFPGMRSAGSCRPAEYPPGRGRGAVRPHFLKQPKTAFSR